MPPFDVNAHRRQPLRGLYVHIPFCRSKCGYCDFLSFGGSSDEQISRYLRCLIEEMSRVGASPRRGEAGRAWESAPSGEKSERRGDVYSSVYVGGGTPTSLGCGELEDVLRAVRSSFEIEEGSEFTVEANPESLSETHLRLFETFGVNRVSLGIQSFDERALEAAGRAAGLRAARSAASAPTRTSESITRTRRR